MIAAVSHFEHSDLSDRQRAALRVADDYLVSPGSLSDAQWEEILRHLSEREVVEIVTNLWGYTRNKIRVSLGMDLDEISRRIIG
jgi:alkylhydroperoxidase family enzyme